eukprot:CAMPEP_0169465210 /NCGR_PEP_ID=MMETSP1042-20121227/21088_1 /TAXON_ID=464988 /ORGANISM="Hemiselmis andersenii, Strain CCMP1180" /LENGTH=45 /DNA_ID= /DNA_START= /DNA_END= /DNA_ORIENTATION=
MRGMLSLLAPESGVEGVTVRVVLGLKHAPAHRLTQPMLLCEPARA